MRSKTIAMVFLGLAVLTGCSAVPHRVDLMYQPQTRAAKGSSGRIYLATPKVFCNADNPPPVRWVIGRVREKEGGQLDEITSAISPRDQVNDALMQELQQAGYQLSTGELPPESVTELYLRLHDVTIDVDEETTWYAVTTKAKVSMQVELWQGGQLAKRTEYHAGYQESYPRDRSEELPVVLQKALEGAVGQAVPDIVSLAKVAAGKP
ncbi:YajG family lipoprotein [Geomesophilobacter sediminis]|uniref:Lipoprotein n=1 Tax=Geomesophilobacter sediminis TaxID=2798584 RepID=A0A8J7JEP0_9BACT|nr:YajG family lipoprotein [Geomesophilobacter sediminis]MBJ6725751.1 hypothetical protein [Geomesophilobacter sediminis]